MQDLAEHIDISAAWYRVEKVARLDLAAIGQQTEHRWRSRNHVRLVEQNRLCIAVGGEEGRN